MLTNSEQRIEDLQDKFRRMKLSSYVWKIFRFAFLLGISYIFLFPVLYMITIAFRSPEAVNDPSSVWIPREISLESIRYTMDMLKYWTSVKQTMIITVTSTIAALISSSLVGYGFARFKFREKNIMFMLLVLTIIVPPQTIAISSFMNFRFFDFFGAMKLLHNIIPGIPDHISLIDTPWTFIMPSLFAAGLRSGLFVFIFRQFFQGMPKDLEEAAKIDGCNSFKTFVQIMLPLAKPAIITVLLFSFIWHWNDFYLSATYYYTDMPISVMLNMVKSLLYDLGVIDHTNTPDQIRTYLQAGSLLTILPPLLLYIVTQKFFTESIERTGIVG